MRENPKPNEIFRHFKGMYYRIITIATDSETLRPIVVYQQLYGEYKPFVRDLEMFMSPVDREKYPDAEQEMRFERIGMPGEVLNQSAAEELAKQVYKNGENTEPHGPVVQNAVHPEKKDDNQAKSAEPEGQEGKGLVDFLDASTAKERLDILDAMKGRITDYMLDTMAYAIDMDLSKGDLEERINQLRNLLELKVKFESSRRG